MHELNDDGVSGDAVEGDGYFSATISPVVVAGEYRVGLELSWPEFDHVVSSEARFRAQAFPSIEITSILTEEMRLAERSKVATVFVHVQGQPFAISTDEINSALGSNADEPGVLEIIPKRLVDQGRAWLYEVFFTPEEEGDYNLMFRMNLEYGGRQYSYTSDAISLNAVSPSVPQVQEPELAVVASVPVVAPPPALVSQLPPPKPRVRPSGFPWGLLAIPIIAFVGLGAGGLYWFTRTRPYGYLLNDRHELVVDFASLRRHPIVNVLLRNYVRGKELGVPGLEHLSFRFFGKRIGLHASPDSPTVRVNNQPLSGEATTIGDGAWIGTHGRLFSFLLSPPAQAEPGFGDD
jgi:hypothetical protein